jgi:hypothetical protein
MGFRTLILHDLSAKKRSLSGDLFFIKYILIKQRLS